MKSFIVGILIALLATPAGASCRKRFRFVQKVRVVKQVKVVQQVVALAQPVYYAPIYYQPPAQVQVQAAVVQPTYQRIETAHAAGCCCVCCCVPTAGHPGYPAGPQPTPAPTPAPQPAPDEPPASDPSVPSGAGNTPAAEAPDDAWAQAFFTANCTRCHDSTNSTKRPDGSVIEMDLGNVAGLTPAQAKDCAIEVQLAHMPKDKPDVIVGADGARLSDEAINTLAQRLMLWSRTKR